MTKTFKKGKFARIFSCMMALTVLFSMMCIPANAASAKDIDYGTDSVLTTVNLDNATVQDYNPKARTTTTIPGNTMRRYDIGYLSAGTTVKIVLSWSGSLPLHAGLALSSSSSGTLRVCSSSCTFYATVNTAGNYDFVLANPNSSSISVTFNLYV